MQPSTPTDLTSLPEQPQRALLTGCLTPRLEELHPDGQYLSGEDCGISWRQTNPPTDGCKSPDWFYVPDAPPLLDGHERRSYVLWEEGLRPLIAVEFVTGDGREEHDDTPFAGKYWVYERGIGVPFYAIFDGPREAVELYALWHGRYEPVPANPAGRYPVEPLGVELGLWRGVHRGEQGTWLRVWDAESGKMLPSTEERAEDAAWVAEVLRRELYGETGRAEIERERADLAEKRAELAERRAEVLEGRLDKLQDLLRALGVSPDAPA